MIKKMITNQIFNKKIIYKLFSPSIHQRREKILDETTLKNYNSILYSFTTYSRQETNIKNRHFMKKVHANRDIEIFSNISNLHVSIRF